MGRVFIVYDTETTGLKFAETNLKEPSTMRQRGDEVCQIGGLILNEAMVPQQLFCHYCDTVKIECDKGAQAVNGLHMEEIRQYVRGQYLSSVLLSRLPEFFHANTAFIGYNVEFDMGMVRQTLSNSDVPFEWTPLRSGFIPKQGRISIDVSEYFKRYGRGGKTYYAKLSSLAPQLEEKRQEFYRQYGYLDIQTNCSELFVQCWNKQHSAFFDALNTYLLWRDSVWQKKLL